jgi:hypothetical protein
LTDIKNLCGKNDRLHGARIKQENLENMPWASDRSSNGLERAERAYAASSGGARHEMIVLSCGACVVHRDILFRIERQPCGGGGLR